MSENLVHFRLTVLLADLQAGPPPDIEVRFEREDAEFSLTRLVTTDGEFTDNLLLTAITQRSVSEEMLDKLTSYVSEKNAALPATNEAGLPIGLSVLTDDGLVTGADVFWFLAPGEDVRAVFSEIFEQLRAPAARFADILKWRFNRPDPANPMSSAQLTWSLDGGEWNPEPGGSFNAPLVGSTGPILEPDAFQEIYDWWESDHAVVPVSRQILVDANAQLGANNRAAFVLAVSAVEVGVKEFCSRSGSADSESWLLREVATPPLWKLLRDYIVFFTDRRTADGRMFPKPLLAEIQGAVETRNMIVHRGELPPSDEKTAAMLVAANDVLYLLDWLAGHDWALDYVTKEVASAYE